MGLSPRVRGNQQGRHGEQVDDGSIPACTGKPSAEQARKMADEGLSPRVRGNQQLLIGLRGQLGSIPACTGKPTQRLPAPPAAWVYPRVYGETRYVPWPAKCHQGLSPRVRGNHHVDMAAQLWQGSIAACTGKPSGGSPCRCRPGSIPACTGKPRPEECCRSLDQTGLSPRVRGNLFQKNEAEDGVEQVYPRVYGETVSGTRRAATKRGLSPRVRGNPVVGQTPSSICRSIPACTGKPHGSPRNLNGSAVYPRVYGETRAIRTTRTRTRVYPRVYGETWHQPMVRSHTSGSIPACTGKPRDSIDVERDLGVYPRVYGKPRSRVS